VAVLLAQARFSEERTGSYSDPELTHVPQLRENQRRSQNEPGPSRWRRLPPLGIEDMVAKIEAWEAKP